MKRPNKRQQELDDFTREAIEHGLIGGPPRHFKDLASEDRQLIRRCRRLVLARAVLLEPGGPRVLAESKAELIWAMIWGPPSEDALMEDVGRQTLAPTDPAGELKFHV